MRVADYTAMEQVPENPNYDAEWVADWAEGGVALVPWSGGLDSTTALVMAANTFQHVIAVPFVAGQPWDNAEVRARYFLWPRLEKFWINDVEWIDPPEEAHTGKVFGHIHVARNYHIALRVAEIGVERGYEWGALWLGWLHGEMPMAGGDKSWHALSVIAAECDPFAVHVPFWNNIKSDLLRMWESWGGLSVAADLYSCFAGGILPCGMCQACFRTWVAWVAIGQQDRLPWAHYIDYTDISPWWPLIEKYTDQLHRLGYRRGKDTEKAMQLFKERNAHTH